MKFEQITREHPNARERVFEDVHEYVHMPGLTEVIAYHIDNINNWLSQTQFLSNPMCFYLSMVKVWDEFFKYFI